MFVSVSSAATLWNSDTASFWFCSVFWYPNLNKRLKSKLQIIQNKCIRFCLNLKNRTHISLTELENFNCLPVNDHFEQFISSVTFKFFSNTSPLNMIDVFKLAGQHSTFTRIYLLKLNQPLQKQLMFAWLSLDKLVNEFEVRVTLT